MEYMDASDSLASAFASMVLPQPGGPYSSTPLCASMPSLAETSGWRRGTSTISFMAEMAGPRPPTSS